MDNKKYFITSAILAFSLYFLFLFLFFYLLDEKKVRKIDAKNKVTVLQLDIVTQTPTKDITHNKLASKQIETKSSKKVVKRSKSVSAKKRTNLKSLFANVKTKSAKIVKSRVSTVKKSSIASRFKSKFEKEKKVSNISLSKLVSSNKQKVVTKKALSDTKNEDDPYYSKIYNIISSRWEPTIFYNDLKAKVIITISSNGTFSYEFIQYSNNSGFDNQLKAFLDEETTKKYPVNRKKKTTKIEIVFRSKGE